MARGLSLKSWQHLVLEKTLESPLACKEFQPVHSKRDQPWVFFSGYLRKKHWYRPLWSPSFWSYLCFPGYLPSWVSHKRPSRGESQIIETGGCCPNDAGLLKNCRLYFSLVDILVGFFDNQQWRAKWLKTRHSRSWKDPSPWAWRVQQGGIHS